MGLGQMGGLRQIALVKQGKHLRGGNIGYPKLEAVLAYELFGLG